jgi:integrase/recombinase XerC
MNSQHATPETSTALAPVRPAAGALAPRPAAQRLYAAFLAGRSPPTLRAYRRDLADFAAFAGGGGPADAAGLLLARGQGGANALALAYRADLLARGLSPATVNRRLAALRSLVKLARTLGQVAWALDVEGVRAQGYRDTRGPGQDGFLRLLAQLAGRTDAKALRDRALLRLLYDLGLRRKEAVGLDAGDVDLRAGTAAVLGQGRAPKERLTLPGPTRAALSAWLVAHPLRGPGGLPPATPFFVALDPAHRGHRLTGDAVSKVVRGLGAAAGLVTRPHGLRHAAIRRVLDLTHGDLRSTQRFSRHRDVRVIERYDDCRRDRAGELAGRLAADAA